MTTLAIGTVRAEHYFQTEVGLSFAMSENFRSAGEVTYYVDRVEQSTQFNLSHYVEENDEYVAAGWQTPRRTWSTYLGSIESPFPGNVGSCYVAHISAYEPGIQSAASASSQICFYGPVEPPPTLSQLCPLVLDLNGDGVHTSGLDDPVRFWDVNFDDFSERTGWTNPVTEEAFLWMDLNGDQMVDQAELFGSAMRDPGGTFYANGFKALEKYDLPAYGGTGDGAITRDDEIWSLLRLWIDRDHDGRSTHSEILRLESRHIVALHLQRVHDHTIDPQGNGHMLIGSYSRRTHGNDVGDFAMVDVSFVREP